MLKIGIVALANSLIGAKFVELQNGTTNHDFFGDETIDILYNYCYVGNIIIYDKYNKRKLHIFFGKAKNTYYYI